MLGSLYDADDALQEALIRAWRALPGFRGRSSLRTWLYRIATNVCLDAIARRPKRVLPVDYDLPRGRRGETDASWIEPYPDGAMEIADGVSSPEARYERREALELAFIAALQLLPASQRVVLVLRDVLGFSARETAEALEVTVASANGSLRRARATLERTLPERNQQQNSRLLGDRRLRAIVDAFADAFERGDMDGILSLLTEDVVFSMPPDPEWCRGRKAVAKSWLMPGGPPPRLRYAATSANGQPALGTYALDPESGAYLPIALDVLALRGERIAEVTAFRTPAIFARFDLPSEL
jgi:RNA polymerase sigma-70 factor (ECF subfamily)